VGAHLPHLFGEMAGGSGANIGTRLKRPFECVIAPWLDANKLSAAMNRFDLHGIGFPTFSVVHEGQRMQGVSLKFYDPARAPLVGTGDLVFGILFVVWLYGTRAEVPAAQLLRRRADQDPVASQPR